LLEVAVVMETGGEPAILGESTTNTLIVCGLGVASQHSSGLRWELLGVLGSNSIHFADGGFLFPPVDRASATLMWMGARAAVSHVVGAHRGVHLEPGFAIMAGADVGSGERTTTLGNDVDLGGSRLSITFTLGLDAEADAPPSATEKTPHRPRGAPPPKWLR
jgi:hypothetical protein